jgi:hypothetical protein
MLFCFYYCEKKVTENNAMVLMMKKRRGLLFVFVVVRCMAPSFELWTGGRVHTVYKNLQNHSFRNAPIGRV